MRLWSLHPKYLDVKGLVALWREGLLARAVLKGKTKGYTNHPQLIRFKNQKKSGSFPGYLFKPSISGIKTPGIQL
nr:pyrimidine dimer DNA glycosylase/endonuclease V [Methanobacterium formicicum]